MQLVGSERRVEVVDVVEAVISDEHLEFAQAYCARRLRTDLAIERRTSFIPGSPALRRLSVGVRSPMPTSRFTAPQSCCRWRRAPPLSRVRQGRTLGSCAFCDVSRDRSLERGASNFSTGWWASSRLCARRRAAPSSRRRYVARRAGLPGRAERGRRAAVSSTPVWTPPLAVVNYSHSPGGARPFDAGRREHLVGRHVGSRFSSDSVEADDDPLDLEFIRPADGAVPGRLDQPRSVIAGLVVVPLAYVDRHLRYAQYLDRSVPIERVTGSASNDAGRIAISLYRKGSLRRSLRRCDSREPLECRNMSAVLATASPDAGRACGGAADNPSGE